jgi:hypothetical protein
MEMPGKLPGEVWAEASIANEKTAINVSIEARKDLTVMSLSPEVMPRQI